MEIGLKMRKKYCLLAFSRVLANFPELTRKARVSVRRDLTKEGILMKRSTARHDSLGTT